MTDAAFGTFQQLQDETFRMQTPDGRVLPLRLTDCAGTPDRFALTFRGGPEAPAVQSTYLLSAPGLDAEPVFLVPVARHVDDPDLPLEYQAIFNRIPTEVGAR